ncbi:MAG: 2'-5' RNA ligase family protein [Planctomycetota bacterium]
MRLFAAIDIDPQVQDRIGRIQERLRQDMKLSDNEVRWVQPGQVHLTLKFLGEMRDNLITQVCDVDSGLGCFRTTGSCSLGRMRSAAGTAENTDSAGKRI